MDASSVELRADMVEVNQLPAPFEADDVDRLAKLIQTKTPFYTRLQLSPLEAMAAYLLNLLVNAKEAAGTGGHVAVELTRREERLEIAVSDDGPGLSDEERQRIYDPFFTTKENGAGLGLALVKRFVEEADGRIRCESNGTRTTFCISIPAHRKAK